jgi:hypothetical protein
VGADGAIRRIAPPARKPLVLEIDAALPAPPPNFDPYSNFLRQRAWKQPDGSFLVVIGDTGGLCGTVIVLFLSRDSQGKPVATADIEHYSDVSSANRGPDPVESGLLTLRSAAWGSGAPIVGRFTMDVEKGVPAIAYSFSVADPFAAAAARPR